MPTRTHADGWMLAPLFGRLLDPISAGWDSPVPERTRRQQATHGKRARRPWPHRRLPCRADAVARFDIERKMRSS